ncbi:hypothetical protein [Dactylosporangium sp. CA-233914]|uniref:hypothetical protein n=1 Tax=Dactylosporangium sp. CA-233914 TaxID=3239934 RepID=UPI003D8ED4A4
MVSKARAGAGSDQLAPRRANLTRPLRHLRTGGPRTRAAIAAAGEVGVGSGVIVDGHLLRGTDGISGEVHMPAPRAAAARAGCRETKMGLATPDAARGLGAGPTPDPDPVRPGQPGPPGGRLHGRPLPLRRLTPGLHRRSESRHHRNA